MPCVTDSSDDDRDKYYRELNKTTDMLCWIMTNLKTTDWLRSDIKAWWKNHQKWDQKRKQEEKESEIQRIKDLGFGIGEKKMELTVLKKKHGVK